MQDINSAKYKVLYKQNVSINKILEFFKKGYREGNLNSDENFETTLCHPRYSHWIDHSKDIAESI